MANYLQLENPTLGKWEPPAQRASAAAVRTFNAKNGSSDAANSKILRFAKSERILHWAIAGPFLISFASGVVLVMIYNPDPSRPLRVVFAELHRISGVALAILPMLALVKGRRDVRIHLYNIKQAWTWIYDDFKWLALMGLAAGSSRIQLPEQGKFNAAEKLNFMVLMGTYPLYVITGLLMWLAPLPVLSWIMHCLMAMIATPLILGHLYMALVNADTRSGLEGMISGHVDRDWAKHHYRRWYRAHYEAVEEHPFTQASVAGTLSSPATSTEPGSRVVPYELGPRRFIHLYRKITTSHGTPEFDEVMRMLEHCGEPPARCGILQIAETVPQFIPVKVAGWIIVPHLDLQLPNLDKWGRRSSAQIYTYIEGIGPRSFSAWASREFHARGNSISTFPSSITPASHIAREG